MFYWAILSMKILSKKKSVGHGVWSNENNRFSADSKAKLKTVIKVVMTVRYMEAPVTTFVQW